VSKRTAEAGVRGCAGVGGAGVGGVGVGGVGDFGLAGLHSVTTGKNSYK
jgi:hypothetical protein